MNNFKIKLKSLSEAKDEFISKDLMDRAQKLGMSMEEIRKYSKKPASLEKLLQQKLNAKYKEEDKQDRKKEKDDAKAAKKALISDKEFNKRCKDAASDWENDNDDEDVQLQHVASDMADSMLYDPEIQAYVKSKLGSHYNKQTAIEFVADSIHA